MPHGDHACSSSSVQFVPVNATALLAEIRSSLFSPTRWRRAAIPSARASRAATRARAATRPRILDMISTRAANSPTGLWRMGRRRGRLNRLLMLAAVCTTGCKPADPPLREDASLNLDTLGAIQAIDLGISYRELRRQRANVFYDSDGVRESVGARRTALYWFWDGDRLTRSPSAGSTLAAAAVGERLPADSSVADSVVQSTATTLRSRLGPPTRSSLRTVHLPGGRRAAIETHIWVSPSRTTALQVRRQTNFNRLAHYVVGQGVALDSVLAFPELP